MRPHYEPDEAAYPSDQAYRVDGYKGIAWRVYGWHVEATEETDGEFEERTGKVVAVMIGDDRRFLLDPDDVHPIDREAYCGVCGQIGCSHDGLERT